MRFLSTLICFFIFNTVYSQLPSAEKIIERMQNYYSANIRKIIYVKNIHKNALKYDTTVYTFAYIPLTGNRFFSCFLDSAYTFNDGILYDKEYFILLVDKPERIKPKKKELGGTMYSWLDHVPAWHSVSVSDLKSWLGKPNMVAKSKTHYVITTNKYFLAVDTNTYELKQLIWIETFQGKTQYNEYRYVTLPDSVQNSITVSVSDFVNATADLPIITFDELAKQKPVVENAEGKKFEFKDLVSINHGLLDPTIKGKYVIFDFFYMACMPCHKMTGYILNWLPGVDTSKIILVGVNPSDSEYNMNREIQNRKINYPIIIGPQAKEIARKYIMKGYPTLLLVAPDGIILNHHSGMSKSFLSKAEKIISR
jgi:hypothetical protein